MNSGAHFVETLERLLEEEAKQLARETGFIQREREINGADFVQGLILGWLQETQITLEGLTQVLQRREVSLSASGWSQRFTPQAADLLERILERLSVQQREVEQADIPLLRQFSAVVIEDTSTVVLPAELVECWQGCGGSQGMSEAAVKLFVRWDVLSGKLEGPSLKPGRCSDQRGPFALDDLPAGCLYVADLGFFSLQRLTRVAGRAQGQPRSAKRFFVSRWQPGTVLLTRGGHRINLHGVLPQQEGEVVEFGAL